MCGDHWLAYILTALHEQGSGAGSKRAIVVVVVAMNRDLDLEGESLDDLVIVEEEVLGSLVVPQDDVSHAADIVPEHGLDVVFEGCGHARLLNRS